MKCRELEMTKAQLLNGSASRHFRRCFPTQILELG
jgi:hypothetical protein